MRPPVRRSRRQPVDDEAILARLVALNAERAAEEKRGLIRWLRPEFQNPAGAAAVQPGLDLGDEAEPEAVGEAARRDWPETLSQQVGAVREALRSLPGPAEVETVARRFQRRLTAQHRERVGELLEILADHGQARRVEGGRYVA